MYTTLALFNLGGPEILVLAILGLLIFGKRLPEVGRSLGKGIVEFKKGLAGVDDEINRAAPTGGQQTSTPRQIAPQNTAHTMDAEEQTPAQHKQ